MWRLGSYFCLKVNSMGFMIVKVKQYALLSAKMKYFE